MPGAGSPGPYSASAVRLGRGPSQRAARVAPEPVRCPPGGAERQGTVVQPPPLPPPLPPLRRRPCTRLSKNVLHPTCNRALMMVRRSFLSLRPAQAHSRQPEVAGTQPPPRRQSQSRSGCRPLHSGSTSSGSTSSSSSSREMWRRWRSSRRRTISSSSSRRQAGQRHRRLPTSPSARRLRRCTLLAAQHARAPRQSRCMSGSSTCARWSSRRR